MKKNLLIPFLILSIYCSAQEKIPFIDYETVYEKVTETANEGAYEETLGHLDRISKNDSTYCSTMVTKSYYLMQLERYDDALTLIDEGLDSKCHDLHSSFFVNKVATLLRQEKGQEALNSCEDGLKRFPQNKILWFNKGVSFEKLGKIEEAVAAYQKTIALDPFYRKAYLQLGNICYKQELISQALMCYNMYLILQPNAENAFSIL